MINIKDTLTIKPVFVNGGLKGWCVSYGDEKSKFLSSLRDAESFIEGMLAMEQWKELHKAG